MRPPEWIVCERTSRWAAALRIAAGNRAAPTGSAPRLFESRRLADVSARLATRPESLVLIETTADNLADVLSWLADARRRFPLACHTALCDPSLFTLPESNAGLDPHTARQLMGEVLAEAGAVEVVFSPRRIEGVLAVARRHASRVEARRAAAEPTTLAEWAEDALAWQAE
jgi:hypothetical protein